MGGRDGIHNTVAKTKLRKKLRNSATAVEAILWTHLKGRQLLGKKFRRQAGISRYIVDFYCPECRLVVELDGDGHYSPTIDEYEEERTKYLESQGLKVIRFENLEIYDNIEGVLEEIQGNLVRARGS